MKPKRELAFYEIHQGACGRDFQEDFRNAQIISRNRNIPIKIKLEITVVPPKKEDPEYGKVQYKHQLVEPACDSGLRDTVLEFGRIVADSSEPPEQLSLLNVEAEELINPETGEVE